MLTSDTLSALGDLMLGREDSDTAFALAIAAGRLSADPHSQTYAGDYMFMGYTQPKPGYVLGKALFKHVDTREYLP